LDRNTGEIVCKDCLAIVGVQPQEDPEPPPPPRRSAPPQPEEEDIGEFDPSQYED
jgi:hypothetical protein